MFNLVATAIFDLLALIIRDILLGGIGYGIKRAYYFLRGQSYKSIKKHSSSDKREYDNWVIGVLTILFLMFLCVIIF